jgi:hypothetical protein
MLARVSRSRLALPATKRPTSTPAPRTRLAPRSHYSVTTSQESQPPRKPFSEETLKEPWKMNQLTPDTLNPAIREVEYAVRGELAIKAEQFREALKNHDQSLPFNKVISTNIGNPQQKGLDQPPITFNRQVRAVPLGCVRSI